MRVGVQSDKTLVLVAKNVDITIVDIEPHGKCIHLFREHELIQESEIL